MKSSTPTLPVKVRIYPDAHNTALLDDVLLSMQIIDTEIRKRLAHLFHVAYRDNVNGLREALTKKRTITSLQSRINFARRLARDVWGLTEYGIQSAVTEKASDSPFYIAFDSRVYNQCSQARKVAAARTYEAFVRWLATWHPHIKTFVRHKPVTSFRSTAMTQGFRIVSGRYGYKTMSIPVPTIGRYKEFLENGSRIKYAQYKRSTKGKKTQHALNVSFEDVAPLPRSYMVGGERGILGIDVGVDGFVGVLVNRDTNIVEGIFHQQFTSLYNDKIRELSTKLSHMLRINHPELYDENGRTHRSAWRNLVYTPDEQKLRAHIARLHSKQSATSETERNTLINKLLNLSDDIRIEDVDYGFWKRRMKSGGTLSKTTRSTLQQWSPGKFQSRLEQRSAHPNIDMSLMLVNPFKTSLSQICHGCGSKQKKKLSERNHTCACGIGPINRDVYSAFLMTCVTKSGVLDLESATQRWTSLVDCCLKYDAKEFVVQPLACHK